MAIKLDPKYAKAYYNRGFFYSNKGEYDSAIKDFNMAIALNPKHTKAYYNRGMAYEKIGNNKEAIKSYKNFLEIAPSQYKEYIIHAKKRIKELQKEIDKNN